MKMTPFNPKTIQIKGISFWLSFILFSISAIISAQTTQTFTTSGTFTVPAGVTSITVEAWGAGGGGGSAPNNPSLGSGGGGGAYAKSTISVIPGTAYSIVVGTGGSAENNGNNTTFNGTTVVAAGGQKGSSSVTIGGIGGAIANSIGTIRYAGGNGGNSGSSSGGGGGGAGSTGSGGNATGIIGGTGTSLYGGNGANGVSSSSDGNNGSNYGGGGSGALRSGGPSKTGGAGSNGFAVISWIQGPILSVVPTTLNLGYVASGSTSSVLSYALSGSYLSGGSGNITVTAPTNFEVSLASGAGYTTSINVPYASSTLISTTIYVRFKPTTTNTDYSGNITNAGGGASPVNVAVTGTSKPTYCTSSGNITYQTSITQVQFNTINNSSAKPTGYSDYTAQVTNVNIGSSYNLSVNVNTDGNYTLNTNVWVDWNQDGDFLDAGESFYLGTTSNNANGPTSLSPLSVSIPSGATIGTTRMRVATKFNATPISCEPTLFDGEVEDYSINILPACTIPTITGSTPASRCGTGTLTLGATASAGTINWYDTSSGGSVLGTGTNFTTPSLVTTTIYYVDATDGSCTTTAARTAIAATVNNAPTAPTANAGSIATCSSIAANWSAASNATTYFLDVSTSSGFGSFVTGYNNLNVGNVLTRSVTGLTAGITYYYRVRASNSCGTSTSSGTITYATLPATPTASTANAGSIATCSSIAANWSAALNATTYFLDVSTSSGFGSFVTGYNNLNVGNVLTSSVTGLTAGITYYYRVRASNNCGTSASSGTITYATLPATPTIPGAITGTATQCPALTSQVYSISAVTNATTYNWTVPTGWTITAGMGTTSITVTTGASGQNGNISVTAGNSCGTSSIRTLAVVVNSCINKWKGSINNDWNVSGNWTQNFVPLPDANIIFDDAPLNHCFLDQNRSVTDITNAQGLYRIVLNGKKLTVKGNTFFTTGATIEASATNSIIEMAGTSAQSIPSGTFYNNEVFNVLINNANNVSLFGNLRLLNMLTIAAGKLEAWTNSPTITYAGNTTQTIESNQFLGEKVYNLTIDNATGVNLNTNFSIENNLIVNAGKRLLISATNQLTALTNMINNGGNSGLVLKSDANGTASLLHNSNNVPATVQRYISRNAEDWHFLSSPIADQPINGSWIPTGTYGNGTGYDLYVWNEPTFCWIYKSNTTSPVNWNTVHSSANFVTGRGYLYAVQATKPTKTFEGFLNNGTINYPITKSTTSDVTLQELEGYNLVGNPYPSSIDWSAATGWLRNSLIPSAGGYDMWIWNPETNNYGVYNSITQIGTNSINRYIAPMQGYFVKAASNGNLSVDNSVRVHNGAGNWFRNANTNNGLIRITVQSETGKGTDEALLQFGYPNNQWGASKIFSHVTSAPSLFINAVKKDYSVQYFTSTTENTMVPVAFKAGADGYFTLNLNFDAAEFEFIQLEDRVTKTKQTIQPGESYRFKATVKDTDNRFALHFTPNDETSKEMPVKMYTDGIHLFIDLSLLNQPSDVAVFDIIGKLILKKTLAGATLHTLDINAAPQVLIIRLQNEQGLLNRKLFFNGWQ